jgi:uncharacterized glyoxalase superfamily protein PhnB
MTQPPAFTNLSPYLRYPDGDAAADWLSRVLGFGPAQCVRDADGHWSEGELAIGPTRIDIHGGTDPSNGADPGDKGNGAGALLIVGVSDVDAQYRRIRDAGAEIDPPRNEDYGPRTCHVTDPWGYQWYFWQGVATYPAGERR